MKKWSKLLIIVLTLLCSLQTTCAFFTTSTNITNTFKTKNYTFYISANGGTFTSSKVSVLNNNTTLPTPTRNGFSFLGYSKTSSGNVIYSTSINNADDINNKNLYAKWNRITYSISYNLDGGTITNQPTSYNVETSSFTLPSPTKAGYEFVGWTGSNGSTPTKTVTINKGSTGNRSYKANWKVINYSISYNLDGGTIANKPTSYNVETNSFTLPTPTRVGYTFIGWTGTGLSSATKSVTINKGSIGARTYTANWTLNYYTVNYYVNGSLWAQRSVGYGNALENLNAQSALDIYHTFHGWSGWVDTMPTNDVNLYANITESYCRLTTGHGPYGNASALLSVFQSAGWTGQIEEQTLYPGNYLVRTDFTLTRAQAEQQKNYIASHTNYNNYNYPYLYWVGVDCTNGYNEAWTRGLGQSTFN